MVCPTQIMSLVNRSGNKPGPHCWQWAPEGEALVVNSVCPGCLPDPASSFQFRCLWAWGRISVGFSFHIWKLHCVRGSFPWLTRPFVISDGFGWYFRFQQDPTNGWGRGGRKGSKQFKTVGRLLQRLYRFFSTFLITFLFHSYMSVYGNTYAQ